MTGLGEPQLTYISATNGRVDVGNVSATGFHALDIRISSMLCTVCTPWEMTKTNSVNIGGGTDKKWTERLWDMMIPIKS